VDCSLCTYKCVDEGRKGGNTHTRARSPRLSRPGGAGRWARAHDVCVNSPSKSGPKPRRPAASFCHLFLLRVCNPRQLFPIYTCGRHENSNIPTVTKIPTHLGFITTAAAPPKLLHPVRRRASAIGRAGLWNRCPQRSCTRRGRIRFLEATFTTARSLCQVLHHGSSTSSSVSRGGLSPST
jgi:hypothetical protein